MDWMDSQLNDEQKLAVKSIVHGKHGIPYLISGPPGTGKTKTIVEAIFQILEHHPTTHILVCGASNSSADTLATRLSRKLGSHALFRLNDPSRPMNEVRIGLQPWCHHENGLWALPPIKDLLSKSVIVTSCVDASLLFSARCTNAALSILEDHFTSHLHSNAHTPPPPFPTRQHFGFLLIDEAAQASEMELCIPLSVVAPAPTFYRTGQPIPAADLPHVTICGDTKQLGPRIESADCRNHDMDVSLLERLFERDVYKNSPFSRKAMRMQRLAKQQPVIGHKRRKNGTVEERHPVQGISTPFCNLTKNYRSHPAILMLPSTLFYEDTLVAYAAPEVQNSPLRGWPALRTSDFPFLFVGKTTPEEWTDQRLSYYNSGEIGEIISIVTGLLGKSEPTAPYFLPAEMRGKLLASEISVISPFREQVWRVRQALRTLGLAAVDVGDVESLQGAENRVVIVSTVRSSSRFLAEDQRMNRGVIFEAKRFNVALTRAKELLIVVGNADVLRVDPWWKLLLTFAMRNNAYVGPPIPSIDRASVDAFSRLEEEWNLKHATDKVKKTPHQSKATLRPEVVSYPSSSAGTATAGGSTPESLGAQTIADEEYMPGEGEDDDEGDTTQGFVIAGSLVREALQEDFDFDI
ncbi:P-loop containing nucleoside triphosphate hydrolase protein [Clavulina sp. PMI_390]|nr:P-loop containing nucleoside triphosphate hydrolase protein [Clavulina sp. PMI_390]